MNRLKQMQKAFGVDEFVHFNFPIKISNVRLARLLYGNKSGCSYCFPHGYETVNSTVANRQRNWKRFRKTKWKEKADLKKPRHSGLLLYKPIQFTLNGFISYTFFDLFGRGLWITTEAGSGKRCYMIGCLTIEILNK